ncbi:MAG: hypothetical protein ACFFAL_00870 [Promethearchaeota archaeon]
MRIKEMRIVSKPTSMALTLVALSLLGFSLIPQASANYGEVRSLIAVPSLDRYWFPASEYAAFMRAYAESPERMLYYCYAYWHSGEFSSQEALMVGFGIEITLNEKNQRLAQAIKADFYVEIFIDGESLDVKETPVVYIPQVSDPATNHYLYQFRFGVAFKPGEIDIGEHTLQMIWHFGDEVDDWGLALFTIV